MPWYIDPLGGVSSLSIALMALLSWRGSAGIPGVRGRHLWLAGGLTLALGLGLESYLILSVQTAWLGLPFLVLLVGFALEWLALDLLVGAPGPRALWVAILGIFAVGWVDFGWSGPGFEGIQSLAMALAFAAFLVPFYRSGRTAGFGSVALLALIYLAASASFGLRFVTEWLFLTKSPLVDEVFASNVGALTFALGTAAVLSGNLAYLSLITTRHARELKSAADGDPLTGILNRRGLTHRFETDFHRVNDEPLSVAMVDIDHFKAVNDQWGHGVGDLVLRHVAAVLGQGLRKSDLLARYGGEEFCLVMAGTDHQTACRVMDRLRQQIADQPLVGPGHRVIVTVSAGIATRVGAEMTLEVLQTRADERLYVAKATGRNRVIGEGCPPLDQK